MIFRLPLTKINCRYFSVKFNLKIFKRYLSSKFNRVSHIIFDLDGLLIDTEHANHKALSSLLEDFGKKFTNELQVALLGRTKKDICKILVKNFNLPTSEDKVERIYDNKLNPLLINCPLMPGAEKLIRHCHKEKLPIAVATSSTQDQMIHKTKHLKGLFSLFHHIVCGGTDPEVKRGKPHPDIFLVCASRFDDNPDPKKCLVFEDAPNGATGARDAGMQCVLVPDPETPRDKCKHATLVLKSLTLVRLEQFCLPRLES